MSDLGKAISITTAAFEGKTDRGGVPYILHCLHVMNAVGGDDELKMIAVMHDLIEDTDWTIEDIEKEGFSDRVVGGLILMTHEDGVPYEDYVKRLAIGEDEEKLKWLIYATTATYTE